MFNPQNYFMNRRELLKMVAAATGGVVIGGEFFLAGCKNPEAGVGNQQHSLNLMLLFRRSSRYYLS
jgi:hypothetical protein